MILNKYFTYIILLLFISVSSFAIYSDISFVTKKVNNIEVVDLKLQKILSLRELIQELQKERGLTNIYYSGKSGEKSQTLHILKHQRIIMDKALVKVGYSKLISQVEDIRKKIDDSIYTKEQSFNSYTKLILSMILETKKLLLFTNDQEIKNHFLIYQNSNFVQEYLGQLRAEIGGILETKKISPKQHISVARLQTLVKNYIMQNQENIRLTGTKLTPPLDRECFIKTKKIIQNIVDKELDTIKITSIEWFDLSTCAIDAIGDVMDKYLAFVDLDIENKLDIEKTKLYYHIVFWGLLIFVFIIFTMIFFRTNKKMLEKQKLLEDYKKAIDNSTIVSKTDRRGIITYVNKAFCDISGYTKEELLGKPHNMVRHPSVPKEAFRNMWKTIKSGSTWNGQIVNLAKDKSSYWVDASISPIYDDEDNLVEYIAIRHDITEIIELNKEIKNTQYELIYRMGESVESRSKESGHHIQRVAHYSKLLAQYYGLSNQESETIFIASTMHDMGKIAIPDSILLKKDKLTNDEWEIMKTHSAIGYKILAGSKLPILTMAANIAYEHHERYDGTGYPRGIKGEDISIYARIVAIADVFDALISERVYKEAWPLFKVLKLFDEEIAKQFDPKLIQLFMDNIDEFIKIKNEFKD